MPVAINHANSWKAAGTISVNVNHTWRRAHNVWVNVNGSTWKPSYSYSWYIGPWGACSANCGGGTQTREVYCLRNDNVRVDDIHCLMTP